MKSPLPSARVLLLVEDNPGDADLVRDMLSTAGSERFEILQAPTVAGAIRSLQDDSVDVIVLDLRLPDCGGVDSVKAIRAVTSSAPIIVLTGADDDALALACIEAGAQDYLHKGEVRPQGLRRAIGYAVGRMREQQLHEMQDTLLRYRSLSTASQGTAVTAALAGSGAVSLRNPQLFARIVANYYRLLEPYLLRETEHLNAPRADKEQVVTQLGDASGGPRDLLDVHVAALDQAMALFTDAHASTLVFEARLMALEMMGLLVDYYRVGLRRRFTQGNQT